MRSKGCLALLTVALLLSGAASAVEHHEDYDKAELDLMVLQMYVLSALKAVNGSLEHCLALDTDGALRWADEYSSMVRGAEGMLEEVPEEVDSYEHLLGYIAGLGRVEANLTSTVRALADALLAARELMPQGDPVWEEASVRENLTRIDSALVDLERGLTLLGPSADSLLDDLTSLELSGINVSRQRALASMVKVLGDNVSSGLDGPWVVLSRYMVHPMSSWALELDMLLRERGPSGELERCSGILSSVLPLLTGGLRGPFRSVAPSISAAVSTTVSFWGNQSVFLSLIVGLEGSGSTSKGLAERVSQFETCKAAIGSMEGQIPLMRIALIGVTAHDDGSVRSGIDALEDLLGSYRDRLRGIELLDRRFELLTEMVNATFWSNVLDADADHDGTLSLMEARNLGLGSRPSDLSGLLSTEWATMKGELLALPEWLLSDLRAIIGPLDDLVQGAVMFTGSHYELLEGLDQVIGVGRSGLEVKALTRCFDLISDMRAILYDIPKVVELLGVGGVEAPDLYLGPLSSLLDLYTGLLLDAGRTLNETFLSLTVWPSVVPYDSELRFSVVLLDRMVNGEMVLPTGPRVRMDLDGVVLDVLTFTRGIAFGAFTVQRNLTLGVHLLEARSTNSSGADLNDSAPFTVRKIATFLSMSAPRTELGPGETVPIHVEGRDELLRPYIGNVTLNGSTMTMNGSFMANASFENVGTHKVTAAILPTDHFEASSSSLTFEVVVDPSITLEVPRNTVYLDEDIDLKVTVGLGEGQVLLFIDGADMELGGARNGTLLLHKVPAMDLGPGTHTFQAVLLTSVRWARSGESLPVQVEVLEREEEEEEEPPPPIENVTWEDEEDPSFWDDLFPDWDLLKSPIVKLVLVALVLISLMVLIVLLVIKLRRDRARRDGVRLPKLYMSGREVTTENGPAALLVKGPKDRPPEPPLAIAPFGGAVVTDPGREELIRMYLDIIDGSSELGMRRSMTPREAASRLSDLGFDPSVSIRLSSTFERSIYERGVPDGPDLSEFKADKGLASRFVSGLKERLGPILGRGGKNR